LRIVVAIGFPLPLSGFQKKAVFLLDKAGIISYFAYASVYITGFITRF
jgi:hypothetical protein